MSTVNPTQVSEYAQRDGENAARSIKPIQSVEEYLGTHPEIAGGDEDDKTLYRNTFRARYNQTVSEMAAAGMTYFGKTPQQAAEEAAAAEASKKTVTEWENSTSIPNWSVAKAVASNFDADVASFQARVAANAAAAKSADGLVWGTRYASFYAQWKTLFGQIQSQSGGLTPTTAVAKVREARVALVTLMIEFDKIIAKVAATPGTAKDVYVPPTPPKPQPVPNVSAKSKIPGWGIFAALAAIGGGVWYAFFRKKDSKPEPKKLGMGAGAAR
jgi:DNA-binding XRE family transcriptional regulator